MRRILAVVTAVLFLLTGCGTSTAAPAPKNAEEVFNTLSKQLPAYDQQAAEVTVKLLGIDPETVTNAYAGFAQDGGPQLLVVVEGVDNDAALKAGERMNYYLTTLQNSAAQYAPEQVDMLKSGYIYTKDNLAVMVVSDSVDQAKQELAKLLN